MKEVLLVAKGKLMAVKAEGLKELAHRALQYGPVDEDGMVHGYNAEEELFPSREEAVRVLEGTIARLDAALVEEAQDFWVFRDEAGGHLVVSILPASECGGEE